MKFYTVLVSTDEYIVAGSFKCKKQPNEKQVKKHVKDQMKFDKVPTKGFKILSIVENKEVLELVVN